MRIALATTGVLVLLLGVFPAVASAARPTASNAAFAVTPNAKSESGGNHGHGGGGGPTPSGYCGTSGTSNCGFDVSYPQCPASSLSAYSAAFAIVGVNGGLANDYNSCLSGELSWASGFPGLPFPSGPSQPAVSLYVNTADPGNMYNNQPVADWPTSPTKNPSTSTPDPYGSCTTTTTPPVRVKGHWVSYIVGANSKACAWQYGYNMVQGNPGSADYGGITVMGDVAQVVSPGTYTWWLDVEIANSWQADTTMNVADLQGMIQGFQDAGVPVGAVGVYSTSTQWDSITGGTSTKSDGSLYQVPTWIPGASSESSAQANCSLPSFTGGTVTLTQWTGTLDSDYFCLAPSA